MDRSPPKKVNMETVVLKGTLDQLDLVTYLQVILLKQQVPTQTPVKLQSYKLEKKRLEGYSGKKTRSLLSKENKIVNRLFDSVLCHSKVK